MNNLASKPSSKKLLPFFARLCDDVSAMADLALGLSKTTGSSGSSLSNHMADKDTDQFEQGFARSLVQNDEETLQWFADALDHIERGAYGACARKISQQRLNVLSFTAYYVKCASEIQAG